MGEAEAQTPIPRFLRPVWDFSNLMERAFEPLFKVFVYLIVLLPSGTVLHVNVKLLMVAILFPPAMSRLFRHPRLSFLHLSVFLLVPTAIMLWVLIGQLYSFPLFLAIAEYKDMSIMLVSAWLIGVAIGGDQQARERFLCIVLKAEIAACLLKVGLLCFAAIRGISVLSLVDTITVLTGNHLMSAGFGDSSSLGRIQFTADGLIPLCLYLLMKYRGRLRIGSLKAFVFFVLLTVSLVLTFSRYFWAFSGVAILLGLLFGTRDRFYLSLLTGFSLLFVISLPIVLPIAMLRFSADVAGGSDDVRVIQTDAMKRYFWSAPLLGHGLGSHTDEIVRSADLPYVYEVQLLALANQMGIIGLMLMVSVLLYYFHALLPWNRPWRGTLLTAQLSTLLLLGCWIAAGLFNPILLTSAAAVSFGFLKALGEFEEPMLPAMA